MSDCKKQTIIVLGASFDTGNLGVSALAWSTLKLIRSRWPEAEIKIIGTGRHRRTYQYITKKIDLYPVRFSPKIWVKDHVMWIWFCMLLLKILPFTRKRFTNHKSTLSEILSADVICDITGGDSFSDIYGMQRLVRGYFLKRLCQMTGRPFVMLPQTYGPFKSRFAEKLARKVLEKSSIIYSRDAEGIRVVEQLLGSSDKIMLCPDVAFILDAVRPHHDQADRIDALRAEGYRIIGLNISGLLLNGGYTRDNMFDLICDYQLLIRNIISYFTSQDKCIVMLVPHVISEEMEIENDLNACRTIFQMLPASERDRVLVLDGRYDQNQVKYFIGQCEFFMGSRMHSTIAAISQCIPAAGLAYSKKFIGVFRTVAVEDCVVDLRTLSHEKAKNEIERIYEHRDDIHQKLLTVIPEVKQKIFSIFESIQI